MVRGRRRWHREAHEELLRQREQAAQPIAASRPARLLAALHRLEENHLVEVQAGEAYGRWPGADRAMSALACSSMSGSHHIGDLSRVVSGVQQKLRGRAETRCTLGRWPPLRVRHRLGTSFTRRRHRRAPSRYVIEYACLSGPSPGKAVKSFR